MQREEGLQKWGRIGCATKKRRSKAASRCAVIDENGQRNIISGKEPFKNAAAKYIDERYRAGTDAPINSGQLHRDLGHLADTESAQALLRGDYAFPEESDEATVCIFREIALLYSKQRCPLNIKLEPSDFWWWRTAPEKTESSMSTIGFSHYIAQSHSDSLTCIQIKNLT